MGAVLTRHHCLPERGLEGEPPIPRSGTELCKEPLTGQHGDERKAVVLRAAPVAGFSQHVSVEHLMVEFLDPGLGEDHHHPAVVHLLHELFLQRRSQDEVTKFGPLQTKSFPHSTTASSPPPAMAPKSVLVRKTKPN